MCDTVLGYVPGIKLCTVFTLTIHYPHFTLLREAGQLYYTLSDVIAMYKVHSYSFRNLDKKDKILQNLGSAIFNIPVKLHRKSLPFI